MYDSNPTKSKPNALSHIITIGILVKGKRGFNHLKDNLFITNVVKQYIKENFQNIINQWYFQS